MMKPRKFRRRPKRPSVGSALIISLVIILFITILLLGFTVTSRLDNLASHTRLAGTQAAQFARMGVDTVMAKLLAGTDPTNRWISQPGRLIIDGPSGPETVNLSSGGTNTVVQDVSVNLNPSSLMDASGFIQADAANVMPVRWIYVMKDGSHVTNGLPSYDPENPVLGRYAYWADDDSTRINLNTAWSRDAANTNGPSHPSQIDLTALTNISFADAQVLADFRITQHLLNFPGAIRAVTNAPDLQDAVHDRKFLFTHYNHSPDLNVFNEPRIVLTTSQARAGAGNTNFIDILNVPNSDPGEVADLDFAKVNVVFNRLYDILTRDDWPMAEGKSFVNKYGQDMAEQIAINIIDYVRSVESTNQVVEPLSVKIDAAHHLTKGYYDIMGNSRRPLITEVGVAVPSSPNPDGKYNCTLVMEIYLPAGAGRPVDLSQLNWYYPTTLTLPYGWDPYPSADVKITQAHLQNGQSLIMNPGDYRVLTATVPTKFYPPPAPPQVRLKTRLYSRNPGTGYGRAFLDCVSYSEVPTDDLIYITEPGKPLADIQSLAVQDPIVNKQEDEWVLGLNTFGGPAQPNFSADNVFPQQDTDSTGTIIDAFSVEQSQGEGRGVVESVGELGYIHTGLRGSLDGVPWRTLRLQPRKPGDASVPDWALLDMFSVPQPATTSREQAVTRPGSDVRGGTVNINSFVLPFAEYSDAFSRTNVLKALLEGAARNSSDVVDEAYAETLISNLVNQDLASAGGNMGRLDGDAFYRSNKLYLMPGVLSEVAGFADGGEESETLLREIIGLTDTRGSVFTVYAIGQSLQQSPSGKVTVQGETRLQTMLERRIEAGNVKVNVVFEKNLGL